MWKIGRGGNAAEDEQRQQLMTVPIAQIECGKYQPRFQVEPQELQELVHSIKELGVLQPVIVRQAEDRYELVAGERRLRAAAMAGLNEIPALVRGLSEREAREIALVENLQRRNLHFLEEAEGYRQLIADYNLTQQVVADRVGLNQSTVANKLRLLNLDREIRDRVLQMGLSERHARALLELKTAAEQQKILDYAQKKEFSISAWEQLIRAEKEKIISREINCKRRQRIRPLVKDLRLFINSLERGADTMRAAGLEVSLKREREGKKLRIVIEVAEKDQ